MMRVRRATWVVIGSLAAVGCAHRGSDSAPPARAAAAAGDQGFTAETHYAAGQLAESQNNAGAAIAQYQSALKLNRDHGASMYRLGVLQTRLRNYPEAIEAWKSYVRVTHGSATAYSNMGFCYDLAGQFEEARHAYEKGIAHEPNNAACRVNYGLLLARHGRTAEATVQLRQVLTEAQVYYNLASVYEAQGKVAEARQAYGKALQLNPSFTDARVRLARLKAGRATTAPTTVPVAG